MTATMVFRTWLVVLIDFCLTAPAHATKLGTMSERDSDGGANDIVFRTDDRCADIIANTPNAPDLFAGIDVSPAFSSSGLAIVPSGGGDLGPVPLPASFPLLLSSLTPGLGLPVLRRRKSSATQDLDL